MKSHKRNIDIIKNIFNLTLLSLVLVSCENRQINSDSNNEQTYSDLSLDGIESHFQQIWLEDMQYFILERDRNNPHEGFGFMALKGNVLVNKQDSIIAYLQTSMQAQAEILSILKKTDLEQELALLQLNLESKMTNRQFKK
jgi:hypothetical protein